MYDQEFNNFFECKCSIEYNNLLLHIFRHHYGNTEQYIQEWLVHYIQLHSDVVIKLCNGYLKAKGLTLDDYIEPIQVPNNKADEMVLYIMAYQTGLHVVFATSKQIIYTHTQPPKTVDPNI